MSDLNLVMLVCRVTADAELKHLSTGTAICNFNVATNRWDGKQEKGHFFSCKLWGKLAESMSQYLTKGKRVALSGSIEQESWEKDGQKHSKAVIVVNQIQLIDKRPESATGNNSSPDENPFKDNDIDVPF